MSVGRVVVGEGERMAKLIGVGLGFWGGDLENCTKHFWVRFDNKCGGYDSRRSQRYA